MACGTVQTSFGLLFRRRCFYLFISLLALVVSAPFITRTLRGLAGFQIIQAVVLIAAVAAVGRTRTPFVIAVLLAGAALGLQMVSAFVLHDPFRYRITWTGIYIAFYVVAVFYLLRYVFSPDVLTDDKLFGAAAGFLMLAILFTDAYVLVQLLEPHAFGEAPRSYYDLLYLSFGCLTSNGTGDIVPVGSKVRSLIILEQVCGTLFIAILIARLAGIYPAKQGNA